MLFRCTNPACSTDPAGREIFDFEADLPICPKCKADIRRPEHRHTIVKLETIHLHIKDAAGPDIGKGNRYRIACGGSLGGGKLGTAEAKAVTCPKCKATAEYKALNDEGYPPLEERDFQVNVDLKKQQHVKAEESCC